MTTEPRPSAGGDIAVTGIECAVFGAMPFPEIMSWLDRYAGNWPSSAPREVLFRSGRLAAVYGLRMADGTEVAVKVRAGDQDLGRLRAVAACQRTLAAHRYPCPLPAAEPIVVDGRTVTSDYMLAVAEPGDAHQSSVRRLMAEGLVGHMTILRDELPSWEALDKPPAWAAYEYGPWPTPHDPIFDFSVTPPGYEWLDDLAATASAAIGPRPEPDALAHSDWICLNTRFERGRIGSA